MASIRFTLYRVLGAFWLRRRTGLYSRFVESWAYVPAIAVVGLGGFCLVVGGTLQWADTVSLWAALLWFLVSTPLFLLALAFLMSFRGTAVDLSKHAGTPKELLLLCGELLEQHGFRVERNKVDRLLATRGAKAPAETEWQSFPIEVIVTAESAGISSTLSVQCTVGVAANRFIRELVEKTSKAVAELDALALAALDKTLVLRQRALMMGGLRRTIFSALTISALVTALMLTGLVSVVASRFLEFGKAVMLWEMALNQESQLFEGIDLPVRLDLDRFLAAQSQHEGPTRPPEEVLKRFKSDTGQNILVLGVKQGDGPVLLLRPEPGNPLRPLAQTLVAAGRVETGPQKVGDLLWMPLQYRYREHIESILGLQRDQLIGGSFLTFDDLARRATRSRFLNGVELTFFEQGSSVARYRWTTGDVHVDKGASEIPEEVMRASMEPQNFSVMGALIRPRYVDAVRTETRDGYICWVIYSGNASPKGWSGISYAVPAEYDWQFHLFYQSAVIVGAIGFIVVLFLLMFVSTVVSDRIARPVLQVRDALRSISEGDYSVRIESKRGDEIGQLQKLVNYTAGELRKRESIKELMGKYLSKQVADRVLDSDAKSTLAGIRKEVSVLFADVRGFTTYSERHDAEDVTKSLNEYFGIMVDVIAAHEGVLDKYIGDGLMVVFGAPMAQPDHASRAVITALEMQAALQTLNLKRAQRGDEPIFIGIGVNTGLAISGNLGSIKRMEFTVIGDTVNLAARLESRAAQGQILIGKTTYEMVKDLVRAEPLGQLTVKGKTEPVEVWLVHGLIPSKRASQGTGSASADS